MKMIEEKANAMDILDQGLMVTLAEDVSGDGRALLAQTVSRFFERELKEHEKTLASEILLNLLKQAERDLREALAERLAINGNVPHELIVFLANDEISVATPVLLHSPVLTDSDLISIIRNKGADYWQTIAKREHVLSESVSDDLAISGDMQTVLNLVDNQRTQLSRPAVKKIIQMSIKSERLQAPLLRRPEVDAELATDLYLCVSQVLRKAIMERFSISPALVEKAMDQLVGEMSEAAHGTYHVTAEMKTLASKLLERNEITIDLMVKTLRRGQYAFFNSLFAEKLGMDPEIVSKIILKDGGKALAVACRELEITKPEFATIFLLSRGIRKGDKVVDQRELAGALKNFDAIKIKDASLILRSWAKNPEML